MPDLPRPTRVGHFLIVPADQADQVLADLLAAGFAAVRSGDTVPGDLVGGNPAVEYVILTLGPAEDLDAVDRLLRRRGWLP
jgi:hypothetical protein